MKKTQTPSLIQKAALIFFGIVVSLVLIEIILRLLAQGYMFEQKHRTLFKRTLPNAYKILALGESTTALINEKHSSWPEELQNILSEHGEFYVINEGIPAIDTSIIAGRFESLLLEYHPDLVITMMGINDRETVSLKTPMIEKLKVIKLSKWILQSLESKMARLDNSRADDCQRSDQEMISSLDLIGDLIDKAYYAKAEKELAFAEFYLYRQCEAYDELGSLYSRILSEKKNSSHEEIQYLAGKSEYYLQKAISYHPNDYYSRIDLAIAFFTEAKLDNNILKLKKSIDLLNDNIRSNLVEGSIRANSIYVLKKIYRYLFDNQLGYLIVMQAIPISKSKEEIKKINYNYIDQTARKYNVTIVYMQYPLTPVDDIKNYFDDTNDIIFVENYENFKEALTNHTYFELFTDRFAGEFGHTTLLGNKIIAENLAEVILSELNITT